MHDRAFLLELALVVALLTVCVPLRGQQADDIPVFVSETDLVAVAVAVTDDDGNFVTGLTRENFTVYEDGKKQEIEIFEAGLEGSWVDLSPEDKDALSGRQVIGLIMDSSGSMEEDMPLVQKAAIKFLTNIPKSENLFIMDFDESIRLSRYSSDDQRLIADRVYDIEPDGWTALYDAVATYLERVYDLDGRKTLVMFSDGVDSRSTLSVNEVFDMVKMSEVSIHAIHFSGGRTNGTRLFSEGRFLRQLANETGGSYAMGSSLSKIDELYDKILEELFSQYSLAYVTTNEKRDGKYRKIKVEVDVDDVKTRYRRGYYGPEPLQSNEEAAEKREK